MSDRQHVPAIRVYLLGPLRIVVDGRELSKSQLPRNKAMLTLTCLLSRPNYRIAEDEVAELLWPDAPPDTVRITIGSTLSALRSALGWSKRNGNADLLMRVNKVIAIVPDAGIWVDADEFERLLEQARRAEDPAPILEAADRLYAGEYLPAVRDAPWAADRRRYLRARRTELQFELARHRERQGDVAGAAAALESALRDDACDERAARELMLLQARTSRRIEALRTYQQLVAALDRDLNVEPSRETVEVWRQINDDTPPPPSQPGPASSPPGGPGGVPLPRSAATQSASAAQPGPRTDDRLDPSQFMPGYPFPTPERLVGRENELESLERIALRGRTRGQVALIGAPAGTGKSALLGALVQRARRAGFLCLVGGGYEDEGVIPFGPFHDALSSFLLWQPAERVRAELAGGLDDLALLVPELSYHLNLPERTASDPEGDRRRLFGSIHVYLRSLTERHPVLLCLEDLHAADAATLALIEFLARQMANQRLVVVGTFRTEELRPGRPLADLVMALRRRNAEQLDLQPLNRQRTGRLVASLLEGQPSERLTSALYATTEGNPFFVEQLVLALREEGRIDRQDGTWRPVGDISGVPTIVRDVIGQRLDRLSESAHRTLALAAVMGQTFEYGALLTAAKPDSEMSLLVDLDEAFSAQILLDTPTGFAFGHALLREVAYARLSSPHRMALHSRAGHGLEQWAGARASERAAELAHHFSLAGRAPETRQKALHYSLTAGRWATTLSAYREALDHFTHACGLTDGVGAVHDAALRLEALAGRGQAARNVGAWRDCIDTLGDFLTLCDDPLPRARARDSLARALTQAGHTADALDTCQIGLGELANVTNSIEAMQVRLALQYDLALLHFLGGRYLKLDVLAEAMQPTAERLGQPGFLTMAHVVMAWAHMAQGRVEPALVMYDLALDEALRADNKIQIAVAYVNRGVQNYRGARFAVARPDLEQSIAIFRDVAHDGRAINGIQTLSRVWLAEGDLERAAEQAELAQAIAEQTDDRWAAECYDLFGTIQCARSEWELAQASFVAAIDIRTRVGHLAGLVESLLGLGTVFERSGAWSQAADAYHRAVDVTRAMDACPQSVAARWHLGRLLLRSGDAMGGSARIEESHQLAETMPESLAYAPAILALAELRLQDSPEGAFALAERALAAGATVEMRIEGHALATSAALACYQHEAACSHADRAVELAAQFGTPYPLGIAYRARGRFEAATGDPAAAQTLERAHQQFVAARSPHEQTITRQQSANLETLLHHAGRQAEALPLDAGRLSAVPAVD